MNYTAAAERLPGFLRRHVLHFEDSAERALAALAHSLPVQARVLDAGSGEGQHAHLFRKQRYTGVDLGVGDAAWDYSRLDARADLAALPFRPDVFAAAIHVVTLEQDNLDRDRNFTLGYICTAKKSRLPC
jgi:hypothetical protein